MSRKYCLPPPTLFKMDLRPRCHPYVRHFLWQLKVWMSSVSIITTGRQAFGAIGLGHLQRYFQITNQHNPHIAENSNIRSFVKKCSVFTTEPTCISGCMNFSKFSSSLKVVPKHKPKH